MKLYFKNSNDVRRHIATPRTEKEAFEIIHTFCEERNFKIYYTRTWTTNNNEKVYDVGSHTEFFYLIDD